MVSVVLPVPSHSETAFDVGSVRTLSSAGRQGAALQGTSLPQWFSWDGECGGQAGGMACPGVPTEDNAGVSSSSANRQYRPNVHLHLLNATR